jgi:hypothetical protein
MQFHRSYVVSLRCFFGGIKQPEKFPLSFHLDSGTPLIFEEPDSLVSGIGFPLAIAHVLRESRLPQIFFSIIECVMVFVVGFARTALKNSRVHSDLPTPINPTSVENFSACSPVGIPVPLHEEVVIFRINECILALRQGDKFVRWVKRLYDSMAFHASFHWLTSNELVMQPLFYHGSAA